MNQRDYRDYLNDIINSMIDVESFTKDMNFGKRSAVSNQQSARASSREATSPERVIFSQS